MTKREMLEMVIAGTINDEVIEMAQKEIASLDAKNAKAKEKRIEKQAENAPIKEAIVNFLRNGKADAASVGIACEISTSKASAMLRQLKEAGVVVATAEKVAKRGAVNFYSLVE